MKISRWAVACGVALVAALIGSPGCVAVTDLATGSHAHGKASAPGHQPKRPTQVCRGKRTVHVTLTTEGLAYALRSMPDVDFCASSRSSAPVISVSDAVHYQRVQGFGAAMTDSSAWLLMTQLQPFIRDIVFGSLFSSDGLGLNFVRVPMGASDFSATGVPYTYDDEPLGETDPTLANFSIAHDVAYVIPALRQARSLNPRLRLLANPWSPPAWMKANGRLDDQSGSGQVLPSQYPALARYFVKFLQAYAADGVPINAITAQNEPGISTSYPGALLDPDSESDFISGYLEPALRGGGLSVGVYGDDLSWDRSSYATALASGDAADDLAGIAWHCYRGSPDAMGAFRAEYPALDEMVSECSPEILGFSTAELLISSLRNGATTVSVWNIALDSAGGPVQPPNSGCPGCKGIVAVSEADHTVHYNGKYFQLGQVSKFVRPGAVRIASTSTVVYGTERSRGRFRPSPGVDNVAFVNPDGSKVLVATNTSRSPQRFTVAWHSGTFRYTLPSRGIVTFTWR